MSTLNQQYNADRELKRKELEIVTPINSIEEAKAYLDKLIDFQQQTYEGWKNGGEDNRFFSFLKNALVVGTDGFYDNKLRFLYELIQNVDDCKYENVENCNLKVLFDTKKDQIVLEYNELGFTTNNVFGISNIAATTKNMGNSKDIEIGEKGLGFKSVFGVADKVLIQSGYFSFSLSKENFIVPKAEYSGYKNPVLGTKMTLFLDAGTVAGIYKQFSAQYKDYTNPETYLNNNPVLFLNKLTSILFHKEDKSYYKFSVSRTAYENDSKYQFEDDVKVVIEVGRNYEENNEPFELNFYRFSQEIIYDQKACQDRYKENCFFEMKKHKIVALVLKGDNKNIKPFAFESGSMYSFLPTSIRTTVPMIFHIPFKLNMSREGIDPQGGAKNKWFSTTIIELREFIKHIYYRLSELEKDYIFYYLPKGEANIFKCKTQLNQDAFNSNAFLIKGSKRVIDSSGTEWKESISDYKIIPVIGGGYSTISEVCQVKGIDDQLAYQMLQVIDPSKRIVSSVNKSDYQRNGIKQYTEKELLGLLFKKLIEVPSLTRSIVNILEQIPIEKFFLHINIKSLTSGPRTIKLTGNQVKVIFISNNVRTYFQSFLLDEPEKRFLENFELTDNYLEEFEIEDQNRDQIIHFLKTVKGRNNNGFINKFSDLKFSKLNVVNKDFYFLTKDTFYYADLNRNLLKFFDVIQNNISDPFSRIKNVNAWLNVEISNLEFKKKIEGNSYLNAADFILDLKENNERTKHNLGKYYDKILKLIENSWSDPKRYIHELLQNADDCKYDEDTTPEFVMCTDDEGFIVSYNEKGFTQDNIRSLTDIGDSTKVRIIENDDKYIGEKGIGFKSIFKVANFVEVDSGDYHFRLNAVSPTIPELIEEERYQPGTQMYVHFKKASRIKFSEDQIIRLILSLKNIKKITIDDANYTVEDVGNQRIIKSNRNVYVYHKFEYQYRPSTNNLLERRKINPKASEIQKITLLIPQDTKKNEGLIYCGLPTLCKVNVPININADFVLTASREGVVDCRWNMEMLEHVTYAIEKAIHNLKNEWGIQVLRLITTGNLYEEEILKDFTLKHMREQEILQSIVDGKWVKPCNAQVFDDFETLLAAKIGKSLAECVINYSSSTVGYKEKLKDLGATIKTVKDTIISLICDYQIERHIRESKEIRDLFYGYLKQNVKEYDSEISAKFKCRQLCPVRMSKGQMDFVSYDGNDLFHSTTMGDVSEKGLYYILEDTYLPPTLAVIMFGKSIQRFDEHYKKIYVLERIKKILEIEDVEERAHAFFRQYETNYDNFIRAIEEFSEDDLLKIPVLLRSNEYVTKDDRFIYDGESTMFASYFVDEEWEGFAASIGVQDVVEVTDINDLPREFYSNQKGLMEMLKIQFNHSSNLYASLIRWGRIPIECLRRLFFEIVAASDLSVSSMQGMRISEIPLSLQKISQYADLISGISTKCDGISFSIVGNIESEKVDRQDLVDMISESLEDTLGREEKNKVNEWISSDNLYQTYFEQSVFIKTEKKNYTYLSKNAKFDSAILSEVEKLIYLLTGTKAKLKREMHAYSNKELAKRITAKPYTDMEVRKLIRKDNMDFNDRESIKDYLCRPTLVDGVVYGGYAKHCPLCGARVHTELTGFRHYVLKQEYSDKGQTKQYKFDIICCKNCFDVFMYCESYWVNVEKWLTDGLLEVRVVINGEYWESKIFRPRLAHQALLTYKNLK